MRPPHTPDPEVSSGRKPPPLRGRRLPWWRLVLSVRIYLHPEVGATGRSWGHRGALAVPECFLKQGGGGKPLAFWLPPALHWPVDRKIRPRCPRRSPLGYRADSGRLRGGPKSTQQRMPHTAHSDVFWFLYSWTVRFLQAETMSYTFCVPHTKDQVLTGILTNMSQGRRRRWSRTNKGDKPSPVGGMETARWELGWWLTDFLSLST